MSVNIDKSLILSKIKSHYSFKSDADFARFLGIKPQTLASWYSRNTMDVDIVYAKCRDINPDFILSGNGGITRQIFSNGLAAPVIDTGSSEIGDRFRHLRESNSYSLTDFAERLKIDKSQYSKIEHGKLSPTLAQCISACGIFSVSMDWLIFGQSSEFTQTEISEPRETDPTLTETLLENRTLYKEIIFLKDRIRELEKRNPAPYQEREIPIARVAEH